MNISTTSSWQNFLLHFTHICYFTFSLFLLLVVLLQTDNVQGHQEIHVKSLLLARDSVSLLVFLDALAYIAFKLSLKSVSNTFFSDLQSIEFIQSQQCQRFQQ